MNTTPTDPNADRTPAPTAPTARGGNGSAKPTETELATAQNMYAVLAKDTTSPAAKARAEIDAAARLSYLYWALSKTASPPLATIASHAAIYFEQQTETLAELAAEDFDNDDYDPEVNDAFVASATPNPDGTTPPHPRPSTTDADVPRHPLVRTLDETTSCDTTRNYYTYTAFVRVGNHRVRIHIRRDAHPGESAATVDILPANMTGWTQLFSHDPALWADDTHWPWWPHLDPAEELGDLVGRLISRATAILLD